MMITGFNMKLSDFAQFNCLFWFYTQMRLFLLPQMVDDAQGVAYVLTKVIVEGCPIWPKTFI